VNAGAGRPRNEAIDRAVIEATQRHLARYGYAAMSLVAVVEEAGTTRQALYRRWPTKADLATSAITALDRAEERTATDDPFADLVAELESFKRGVFRPNGISMVGTMLQDSVDPELRRLYRARIVRPRRARLRAILQRGVASGALRPDADLDVAVTMLTGSWYGRELAGDPVPRHWARRVAALVWRALGGEPPEQP
jgi:AcrR family transcriptional regulator